MDYRILYEPYKTLEEQDKAEQRIRRDIEIPIAIEEEQQELFFAEIEGNVEFLNLKPFCD